MPNDRTYARDSVPRGVRVMTIWALAIVSVAAAGYALKETFGSIFILLGAFIIALMISALLHPLLNLLVARRVPRPLAVAIVVLGTLAVVGGTVYWVVRDLASDKDAIFVQFQSASKEMYNWLVHGPANMKPVHAVKYTTNLAETLSGQFGSPGDLIVTSFTGTLKVISAIILGLVSVIFLLPDKGESFRWLTSVMPTNGRLYMRLSGEAAWRTLQIYMRTLVLVAAIDAGLMIPVMWLADIKLMVPMTLVLFFGSMVPLVGPIVAGTVLFVVALMSQGLWVAVGIALAFVAVVQFSGSFINPLLMGQFVKLHPLVVLFGVTGGTILGGVFGAFVAVPSIAVATSVMRTFKMQRMAQDAGHNLHSLSLEKLEEIAADLPRPAY